MAISDFRFPDSLVLKFLKICFLKVYKIYIFKIFKKTGRFVVYSSLCYRHTKNEDYTSIFDAQIIPPKTQKLQGEILKIIF